MGEEVRAQEDPRLFGISVSYENVELCGRQKLKRRQKTAASTEFGVDGRYRNVVSDQGTYRSENSSFSLRVIALRRRSESSSGWEMKMRTSEGRREKRRRKKNVGIGNFLADEGRLGGVQEVRNAANSGLDG